MRSRSNHSRDNEARALFMAFACGVLTGAACGLLLAPARGSETRHWVAEQGRHARDRVMERNRRLTDLVRREGVRGLLRRARAARRDEPVAGPVSAHDAVD
jgi:hypothetical protein